MSRPIINGKECNVTKWQPDTCGCVVYTAYPVDGSSPEGIPYHQSPADGSPSFKCAAHAALPTTDTHHAAVKAENQTKNAVLKKLSDALPSQHKDAEGNPLVPASWSFDAERKVVVAHPELKGSVLAAFNASLPSQAAVAADKVRVV